MKALKLSFELMNLSSICFTAKLL